MAGLQTSAWPKFKKDYKNSGTSTYTSVIATPTLSWSVNTTADTCGSPSIGSDGTIYVGGSNGVLYAITTGGAITWSLSLGGDLSNSTPTVTYDPTSNINIYVTSTDGKLYCASSSGSKRWEYDTGSSASGGIQSSSAISRDGSNVYFGATDNYVYSVDSSGNFNYWKHPTNGIIQFSSPAIGDDGRMYIGSNDAKIYALNPSDDGSEIWTYSTGGYVTASPTLSSDGTTLYVGSNDSKVYAINTSDGTKKWVNSDCGEIILKSSVSISPDGNTLYVGSYDNKIHAINASTGNQTNVYVTGGIIDSSPAIGSDGTVYFGSGDNYLYALSPDFSLLWRANVSSTEITNSPAIGSDGTLYITVAGTLYAYTGSITPPCFLKGTLILTTDGYLRVEDLTTNHKVITYGDIDNTDYTTANKPSVENIVELQHFKCNTMNELSRPICFKVGSMGDNVPNQDLYVSPLHSIATKWNVLKQASSFVNGDTIAYDMSCDSAEYYHILLTKHSVIYANNMAVESLRVDDTYIESTCDNTIVVSQTIMSS
jgi:outer membrane protein assembly factor BamB